MSRRPTTLPLLVSVLLWLASGGAALAQVHDRQESPFEAIRWRAGEPEVLVRGDWYRPLAIEGVDVGSILLFCDLHWPGQREKRFSEDLVEAMARMGWEPPAEVNLLLVRLSDGARIEAQGVAMSEANRRAIWASRSEAAPGRAAVAERPRAPAMLSRVQAAQDLQHLAARLQDQFAYLTLKGHDWRADLAEIEAALPEQVPSAELAEHLTVFMARFGDGHAGLDAPHEFEPALHPPFVLGDSSDGVVALKPDRTGFLDPDRPFLIAIDGRPVDDWLGALASRIPAGSPQYVRGRALRAIARLELQRPDLGVAASPAVTCTLAASAAGANAARVELPMAPRPAPRHVWPPGRSRLLDSGVGYLRLPEMTDDLVPHLHECMDTFRASPGLIVDVRGNGGGSRDLLVALAGYLIGPDEGPWVASAARYILSEQFDADHLEARFMYPAGHAAWTPRQQQAIEEFAPGFTPEWEPQGGAFSDWHYLVLDRTGHNGEYFYDRPVVVLCDAGCFSATDIFLGALAGRPRVTLMGSPSSGGSARAQDFTLRHSRISIQCASMVSYRPDGRLYDTRGVEVDIEVRPAPTDLIIGGTDTVLDAAERLILSGQARPAPGGN